MKRIFGTVIIILMLFFVIFYKEIREQQILKKEVYKIYKMDINTEEIDMNIKSSGTSAKLEKIIKEYYKELYDYQKEYNSIQFYNLCSSIFSLENLNNISINSKNSVIELYNKRNDLSDKVIKIITDEYAISLIENIELNKIYTKLYKNYTVTNDKKIIDEWKQSKEKDKLIYELTLKAIDILVNNRNSWFIQDNKIYFTNQIILNEYNDIVYKLNTQGGLNINGA